MTERLNCLCLVMVLCLAIPMLLLTFLSLNELQQKTNCMSPWWYMQQFVHAFLQWNCWAIFYARNWKLFSKVIKPTYSNAGTRRKLLILHKIGHNFFNSKLYLPILFPDSPVVKNPPANAGEARDMDLIPESGRFLWKRKWQPHPVFLPGKSHGQRSLAGYRLCVPKVSDKTERRSTHTRACVHAHTHLFTHRH